MRLLDRFRRKMSRLRDYLYVDRPSQALSLAGLKSERFMKGTDEKLRAIIINLWQQVLEKEGRPPQKDDLKAYGFPVSDDTITRRFSSWRKALVRARDSITEGSVSEEQPVAPVDAPRKRVALSVAPAEQASGSRSLVRDRSPRLLNVGATRA